MLARTDNLHNHRSLRKAEAEPRSCLSAPGLVVRLLHVCLPHNLSMKRSEPRLWIAPSDHVRHLKVLQKRRCLATGERLIKNAEVDHHVPLFKVWRDYRHRPWPALLAFWGVPNLQVINRSAHVEKCAQEAGERRVRVVPAIADRSLSQGFAEGALR